MMNEDGLATTIRLFQVNREEAQTIVYLGDSVYATYDGYQVWLRVSNGVCVKDVICLEPPVMAELIRYANAKQAVAP
jgi:hypothetical protein